MSSTPAELPKAYDPASVEPKWYDLWEEQGYFKPRTDGPAFAIMIPPPNVTGSLHVGHALNNTIQDILVRYKRMDGFRVLWQPGTDHAGIATQLVVEKQLKKEGTSRHKIGREAFLARVWAWKEESGGNITRQLRRLGASCDWSRERFTMDEGLSRAVREAFVRLYEKGLIQRDLALINWCPSCRTALSDLEVETPESPTKGKLYHLKYPVQGSPEAFIVVATTRPETMLGDTAVAVHPEDERYTAALAKKSMLVLPLLDRPIPLIADTYVDKEFGSGAVKITPAHDPNDFEVGKRHKLPMISIFDEAAKVNENGGKYRGLDRFEARKRVLADLEEKGLLLKVDEHEMNVGHCQRCNTVVEPYLSPQWFVRTKKLAAPAIAAVREGRTRIIPDSRTANYFHWMENIRDWCISRQLWWGHQIPAWYCVKCNGALVQRTESGARIKEGATPIVAREEPTSCPACGSGKGELVRDEDVLDTWFSSGTWPFSTLGWPESTPALKTFYPTSSLVTAYDIIFFWVARMMMFGLEFMEDVPFKDVYIHGLIRDAQGKKMSKTTGNVLDPLVLMEKHGTDAVRFTLTSLTQGGGDIRLSEERIEGYRNFSNKIWNSSVNFLLKNLEGRKIPEGPLGETLADEWILSRLQCVTGEVRASLDEYRFNDAASVIYQFVWGEVCDWYVEMIKPRPPAFAPIPDATARTALHVFDGLLRLLHPIMPFLTEEIWLKLPLASKDAPSLMVAAYPKVDEAKRSLDVERDAALVQAVITAVRNIRGETAIPPGVKITLRVMSADAAVRGLLEREKQLLISLANLETAAIEAPSAPPRGSATAVVRAGAGVAELFVPLKGIVDVGAEKTRLEKELAKLAKDVAAVSGKLSNESYVAKAPPDVVEKDRAKLRDLEEVRAKLDRGLVRLKEMES